MTDLRVCKGVNATRQRAEARKLARFSVIYHSEHDVCFYCQSYVKRNCPAAVSEEEDKVTVCQYNIKSSNDRP